MNELFDKLIIRFVFAIFICVILLMYKYIYFFFYPSNKNLLFNKFHPSKNPSESLHFFSRLLGIGIIASSFHFNLSNGIAISILDFFITASMGLVFYILSIFILESIVLYNFDFTDEVIKRKNLSYGLISASLTISIALIIRSIMEITSTSLVTFLFLWLFSIVIYGVSMKGHKYISQYPFNKLMIQKSLSLALSFSGFAFGLALIVSSSLNQKAQEIQNYTALVLLNILLSIIIFPIFNKLIIWIFKLENDFGAEDELNGPSWGHGLFEGVLFLVSCFMTCVITGQIHFERFYPLF